MHLDWIRHFILTKNAEKNEEHMGTWFPMCSSQGYMHDNEQNTVDCLANWSVARTEEV